MLEFRRVLCPIDFSDTSIRALTHAAAVARWYGARLDVLHVVPSFAAVSRDTLASEMRRAIAAAAVDVEAEAVLREGRPDEEIVFRAATDRADLLVIGTHGHGGFNRLLLGSVTEKVVRVAPCPVLTVPPAVPVAAKVPVAFKRILCPIDYSASALRSLEYALELGRQAGGSVTVLYALEYVDPEDPPDYADVDLRRLRQHLVDSARNRLHAQLAAEPVTWCEINEVVVIERAYKAILRHAADIGADLIVMGAQGTGGVELLLYGSNTQHVVRAATCPVLTVRA